ncbi:hypothetical protein F5890DRAFT_1503682 [Lentinula detonsa]|uniref:Uncharacterized protein n=1 Tax=Lentinula detonsa TaxID=2804962 RepID=A0AA38Q2Q8_9AGAR|nr:hypothetical protein F5890DRAFT_1503682 [Lentinula detonsa]
MSSHFGLVGKPFSTSPNSEYSLDFGHNHISSPTIERWDNTHRSNKSQHALSSSPRQLWELQSFNAPTCHAFTSQNPRKNPLRVLVDPHTACIPPTQHCSPFATNDNTYFNSPSTSQTSSPYWDGLLSSPSPAISTSYTLSSQFVKKEEPDSPKFIIEPLLPSALVTKRSSSSSPEPCSSPTQAELETQLLLSQALAPPTEVPLRATQACDDMRQMMRSFRLNPFSILTSNGKDSKLDVSACSDLDPVVTWCGEIAKPLDEEPLIFEWQLDDYRSGVEEDLPQLIVMDDVEECLDITGTEDDSVLEATLGEDPESPLIFSPSLLSSEVASKSGFSTPAETQTQHARVGPLSTLPRMSFFSDYSPKAEGAKQRAGSYDPRYESNNSTLASSLQSHPNSFQSRSLDSGPQRLLTDFPMYKKPRFSMESDGNPSRLSTSYDHEIAFRSGSFYEPLNLQSANVDALDRVESFGSEGSSNSFPHSKSSYTQMIKSSKHDVTTRHSSSGSMYIPALLNADSSSSPPLYSTGYPFTRPPTPNESGMSFTKKIHSSTSSLYRHSQAPTSQEVMNVTNIWAGAANPQQQQPHSDSELASLRRFDQRHQQQHYHNGPALPETLSPGPASLPPRCYFGQQQSQQVGHGHSHVLQVRTQPLPNPLTDIAHTRMRPLLSGDGPAEAASLYAIPRGTVAFTAST